MMLYIVISIATRILDLFFIELAIKSNLAEWKFFLEIGIFAYTLTINLGLMIPLGYQLVEQKKRLDKVEEIERTKKRSFANNAASGIHRASIPLRPS
jgi:hypothetical protein